VCGSHLCTSLQNIWSPFEGLYCTPVEQTRVVHYEANHASIMLKSYHCEVCCVPMHLFNMIVFIFWDVTGIWKFLTGSLDAIFSINYLILYSEAGRNYYWYEITLFTYRAFSININFLMLLLSGMTLNFTSTMCNS